MWLKPRQLLPMSILNLVSPYRRHCGSLSSKPRNGNSNFFCSVCGQGHRCSDLDPAEASVCPQPASSISHSSPGPTLVPTAMPAVTPIRATMLSPLPTVSENGNQSNQQCQPVSLIPLIKVPSSTSKAYGHSAAHTVAVANSDRSGTCAVSSSDSSPVQPRASFCSNAKPARRRASDLGLPASKACHRLKKASPGKGHTTSLHHPAVCSNSHTSKSKQQPEVVITAGMKAGPVAFATGLSAGGKGKASGDVRPLSQGVGGKPAQVSPSPRYITLDDLLISQ